MSASSKGSTQKRRLPRSESLFERAKQLMPGGVNSPVRAFGSVGGTPVFIKKAQGALVHDEDGNAYIDYVGSWGPMILGHAAPPVVHALTQAVRRGTSYGAPTALENELAELICELMPSIERVRLVNSGTEATMSALRVARGVTGRAKIVKFAGCYHGHEDSLLVSAGSGLATLGIPGTPGVTDAVASHTLVAPFNDLEAVSQLFETHGDDIAGVIVEPVAGNMGCIPPVPGFLPGLRTLCDDHGALLIIDEVMTGFRVALGGAQSVYGVTPDLTTLGKIIGGGLPVGAYGGRADLMERVAPAGPIYQAGTLSGNPLAVTAGLATLRRLATDDSPYERLGAMAARVSQGMADAARGAGFSASSTSVGAMFSLFLRDPAPTNYAEAREGDTELFGRFFHEMLARGVYLAPSAFEAGFISAAHDDDLVEQTIEAARASFASLAEQVDQ